MLLLEKIELLTRKGSTAHSTLEIYEFSGAKK